MLVNDTVTSLHVYLYIRKNNCWCFFCIIFFFIIINDTYEDFLAYFHNISLEELLFKRAVSWRVNVFNTPSSYVVEKINKLAKIAYILLEEMGVHIHLYSIIICWLRLVCRSCISFQKHCLIRTENYAN